MVGESENHGPEQERLNNVFGARLRITTLQASQGPAVELLEYLAPRDGRLTPRDSRSNDLWHWQIKVQTSRVEAAWKSLRGSKHGVATSGVTNLPEDRLGFTRGFLARDPDGHALLLAAGASK